MIEVKTLRELFRNLQAWQALFESEGIDTILGPDGTEYHLADVEYLYKRSQMSVKPANGAPDQRLSPRQRQAIRLCLFEQVKERDASVAMGIRASNPVAMYATNGLRKIVEMANAGELPRFCPDRPSAIAV